MLRSSLFALLLCSGAALAQSSHPGQQPQSPADTLEEMAAIALPPVQMGGTADPVAPPPAAPSQVRGPVRISGGVMAGMVVNRVNPMYPPDARAKRISGSVVLSATIGRDGTVQDLQLVSGPSVFAEAAMDAVRQWTYKPYQLNGDPVEVNTTVTVNFQLNASAGSSPQ